MRNHIGVRNGAIVILVVSECAFAMYGDFHPFATAVTAKFAILISVLPGMLFVANDALHARESTHES